MKSPMSKIRKAIAAVAAAITKATNYKSLPNTPIITLLMHLCNQDEDQALFVARWIALPLLREGTKMDTALIITGPNQTGKSLFFEIIVPRLFDKKHVSRVPRWMIEDQFNDWANNKKYVVIDDFNPVTDPMSKKTSHLVKSYLTATSVRIDEMAKESVFQENKMNFVFLSTDPIFEKEERRFSVINAPEPRSSEFYSDIFKSITDDDIEEFREWLLFSLDMNGFTRSSTFIPF